MNRPDFFIVGAAKCGTTALYAYLSRHPRIFMPKLKEPKFFCTDIRSTGGVYDAKAYDALFAPAPADAISGEVSCWYLYSRVAIARIMERNPAAKIVVSLRHPVEAAHSLHAAAWAYGHETIADFEEAWNAQEDRLAGNRMPPHWPEPRTLQYGAIYRYGEQLRRLFAAVPERQRHVIVYEEFFADPARGFAGLIAFLGVEADARRDFPIVNPAVAPRSERLDGFLRRPPEWLAPLRPFLRKAGLHPAAMVRRLNSTARPKPPLRPAFRAALERFFTDDMRETEGLLGRPLWRITP